MFSTGQFSKIAQVSKRLLQYYDEIGLFAPASSDGKGSARLYAAEQLPQLFQILALKELGLSLDEIRAMVQEGTSPEEIQRMLVLQRARVRDRLDKEQLRLRTIESRLRAFDAAQDSQSDMIVKSVPAQNALTSREVFPSMELAVDVLAELTVEIPKLVGKAAGPLVAINHCDGFETEDVDGQMGVILTAPFDGHVELPSGRTLMPTTLPAIPTVVASVRSFSVEDTQRSFAALGIWMENTGHQMAGSSREVFLEAPGPDGNALIETQLPIEPL